MYGAKIKDPQSKKGVLVEENIVTDAHKEDIPKTIQKK